MSLKVDFNLLTEDWSAETTIFSITLPPTQLIWDELKVKAQQDGEMMKTYMENGDGETVVMCFVDEEHFYNIQFGERDGEIIDEETAKQLCGIIVPRPHGNPEPEPEPQWLQSPVLHTTTNM